MQNTEEEPIDFEAIQTAPAAHRRYLSSSAAATLQGKMQGFRLRFLPKTKRMQHSCSHYNAACSMTWLTRMHLRTWHHQMTTITQPFQCDLQPQIQETHRTTQTGTTTHCRTQTRNRLTSKRSKLIQTAPAAHRRYRWLQPLYTEKHKVRAPASSATQAPCNIHAGQFFCDVIVMWCKVSHRPSSRSILL